MLVFVVEDAKQPLCSPVDIAQDLVKFEQVMMDSMHHLQGVWPQD